MVSLIPVFVVTQARYMYVLWNNFESQSNPAFKEGGIRSLLLKQTKLIKIHHVFLFLFLFFSFLFFSCLLVVVQSDFKRCYIMRIEHIHESINSQKNVLITKLVPMRKWYIYIYIMCIPLLFLTCYNVLDSRKLILKKDTNNNRSIQVNAYQTWNCC